MEKTVTVELELKKFILSKYKSIRAFTIAADIPYSTVDTMIKKGIGGTGINTMIKICNTLSIDVESLANGYIKPKISVSETKKYKSDENILLNNFNALNFKGKVKLLEYSEDLVTSGNYIDDDLIPSIVAARSKNNDEPIHFENLPDLSKFPVDDTEL